MLIADTKYKFLEGGGTGRGKVLAEDAYQLFAYLVRMNCKRGMLIYPQSGGEAIRQRLRVASQGLEISAATVNLHTPLDAPDALVEELRGLFTMAAIPVHQG